MKLETSPPPSMSSVGSERDRRAGIGWSSHLHRPVDFAAVKHEAEVVQVAQSRVPRKILPLQGQVAGGVQGQVGAHMLGSERAAEGLAVGLVSSLPQYVAQRGRPWTSSAASRQEGPVAAAWGKDPIGRELLGGAFQPSQICTACRERPPKVLVPSLMATKAGEKAVGVEQEPLWWGRGSGRRQRALHGSKANKQASFTSKQAEFVNTRSPHLATAHCAKSGQR